MLMDPIYPAYSVLAILGSCVVLIPLAWHFQAWNAGTCLYMIWTSIACLNLGVNSIVWRSNAIDVAPAWCHISSRIIVAVSVAIPSASLCINRRLYKIATVHSVSVTRAEKRRAVIVDLAIGIGIPMLQIVMQYIVSGHRYDIFEQVGCYPFTYNTWLAYPLTVVWPVVIGLVSGVYCVLTLRAFTKRRAEFNQFLSSSPSMTVNRYFRLMALATAELLCTTPIALYGISLTPADAKLQPWISFADTHFDYSHVDQYPAILWRMDHNTVIAIELMRWAPIFCAVVFFGFFGFADEARRNYYRAFYFVAGKFGVQPSSTTSPQPSMGSLPTPDGSKKFAFAMPTAPSPSQYSKFSGPTASSDCESLATPVYGTFKSEHDDPESPSPPYHHDCSDKV